MSMLNFRSLKSAVTGEEPEPDLLEDINSYCTLSYTNRMIGFGICFVFGWIIAFISIAFIFDITDHPEKFAICFTFGSVCALFSTMFLVGPLSQIQNMFAPVRLVATLIYLASMVLTLYLAFGVLLNYSFIFIIILG